MPGTDTLLHSPRPAPAPGRPGALRILIDAARAFARHDMSTYAAALAYHMLFSLFPFVIFLLAVLSFLDLGDVFEWIRSQADMLLPPTAMTQVNVVLKELQLPQKGLLSTGAATALWLASRGIRALMTALNVAYGKVEKRPAWRLVPLSILFTLGVAIMMLLATALLTVGPHALQWLSGQIGLKSVFILVWTWLRWPAALLLLMVGVATVYYAAPDVRHRFQLFSPGSVLSVLAWIGGSLAFSYYVEHFASYSVMYGSIGAVIVLLLYLYLSAAVLLFGAEINAAVEQARNPSAAPAASLAPGAAAAGTRGAAT